MIPIFYVWCTYLRQTNQKELFCEIGKHVKFKKRQCSLSSKKQCSPTYRTVFTLVEKTVKTQQSLQSRHCSILSNFIIVNGVLTLDSYVLAMKGTSEVIEILFAPRVIIALMAVPPATSHTRLGVNIAKF